MHRGECKALTWIKPDRDSPVSMQSQIVTWLESSIAGGQLGAGERLPAEAVLVERLGVSRVTVRLAFDELVARGLVTRAHGKGSFVASRLVRHDPTSKHGFFDIVLAKADKPEARLLVFEPQVPPPEIGSQFGLADGQPTMRMSRLYLSDGRPLAVSTSWLPPEAIGVPRETIERQSTATMHAELLRRPIVSTTLSISAAIAGSVTARLLSIGRRDAVLVLSRSRYDERGCLRDASRFTADPSRHELTFSVTGASAHPLTLQQVNR